MPVPADRRGEYRSEYYHNVAKLRYKFVALPMEHDMYEEIKQAAKRNGWSIAETMRTFLQWGLDTVGD